jgi:hypothetical protein
VGADHTDAYRYHRRVLQTLQHRRGADRWVLKAPSHLGQLRTLFAVYPDARVVQIHRDPLKTVPSTISLMGTIRSMRGEPVDVDSLVALVSFGYGVMLDAVIDGRASGRLPDAQFVDVRYADLLRDPVDALAGVYDELGIGFDDALADAVLRHLAARPKDRAGPHRYSLGDTGLDVAPERERFRRYQQHYDVPDE